MKTNNAVKTLCSLLGRCKPDIEELAEHSKGDSHYFGAQYRNVALMSAQAELPKVRHMVLPEKTYHFEFANASEKNSLYGIRVFKDGKAEDYTTLDGFVTVDSLPTLVEARIKNVHHTNRYFRNVEKKLEVLESLFPKGYGWILMLPFDHIDEPWPLSSFKHHGGEIAIMPFTAAEMQTAVERYKPHGSDTRRLLVH